MEAAGPCLICRIPTLRAHASHAAFEQLNRLIRPDWKTVGLFHAERELILPFYVKKTCSSPSPQPLFEASWLDDRVKCIFDALPRSNTLHDADFDM
mgnify:CR=1 FL=1